MDSFNQDVVNYLLNISIALCLIPILYWIVRAFCTKNMKKRMSGGLVLTMLSLLFSIWCIRYAVGYYMIFEEACELCGEAADLTIFEEFFNSFIHTMQTFGMDDDYTTYMEHGRAMMVSVKGEDSFWISFYGIYTYVLNCIAPVVGGAFILDLLTSIFPKIKLHLYYCFVWKRKYYFSALNEQSLTLAESIYSSCNWFIRPLLIFADSYGEQWEELREKANSIGAICVRTDLLNLRKNRFLQNRTFLLIDEDEMKNLEALSGLADKQGKRFLKKAKVYLFSQDDIYTPVKEQVLEKLKNDYGFSDKEMPYVITIQKYRNLVSNLLRKLPLYEPLVHKRKKELNVTILGNGSIGTEMFLAVYWFGQILDYRLNIKVVSMDTKKDFWRKIDYINPEIYKSTDKYDDVLLYKGNQCNEPYCKVQYIQSDIKDELLWNGNEGKIQTDEDDGKENPKLHNILDTDYFIIALGSDGENLSAAEKVKMRVGEYHLETAPQKKTVISYVIYDSELCKLLNRKQQISSFDKSVVDIYMQAFGSMEEVYSSKNIFMSVPAVWAAELNNAYNAAKINYDADEDKKRRNYESDYTLWANLSRAMHIKYKIFSLGWIKTSVFDKYDEQKKNKEKTPHEQEIIALCMKYRHFAIMFKNNSDVPAEDEAEYGKFVKKRPLLAWLEHRRWTAFTRTKGFRGTEHYKKYAELTKSHKHMELKLHPCVSECDSNGTNLDSMFIPKSRKCEDLDRLDMLNLNLYETMIGEAHCVDYNFKAFDYPEYEYDDYLTIEQATSEHIVCPSKLRLLCQFGRMKGAYKFSKDSQWLIPKNALKKYPERPKTQTDNGSESKEKELVSSK